MVHYDIRKLLIHIRSVYNNLFLLEFWCRKAYLLQQFLQQGVQTAGTNILSLFIDITCQLRQPGNRIRRKG